MTDPVSAIRALPRFAYLSPAEAREVVLAVLGAVRELDGKALDAGRVACFRVLFPEGTPYDEADCQAGAFAAFRAAIDALVAEVQEEGR